MAHIQGRLEKSGQEVIYYSKSFYSNYIGFLGYETRVKLIWTSGEGSRKTNKIRKKVGSKTNINKISPSLTLSFGCSSHKDTCDILSEYLVSSIFQEYSSKKKGLYWGIQRRLNLNMALDSQQHVDVNILVKKQVLM